MKRLYKDVGIGNDRSIALDGRPVKTPARRPLILPNAVLAQAVADEWRAQGEEVVPASMKLTGLANAAIDRVAEDHSSFVSGLAAYGETELLCYRAGEPPELVARQDAIWNPPLDWARARYDVSFTLITGIMHQPQPDETVARLAAAVRTFGPWALTALNPIVTISGSLVIALAVADGHIGPDAAFDIAHLDELWQIEQWGEDSFATATRDSHRADFLSACRFLNLLG
jgi:chaperone required for assembly of F1-ATPase